MAVTVKESGCVAGLEVGMFSRIQDSVLFRLIKPLPTGIWVQVRWGLGGGESGWFCD